MARGGKSKVRRGGGRNFSRHLELDSDGTAVATDPRKSKRDEEDEEGDEDDDDEEKDGGSEEEESEEEGAPAAAAAPLQQQELSREDRKALKKQGKKKKVVQDEDEEDEDLDPLLANPNRTVGRMKISDLVVPREPSRKETKAKQDAEATERYRKLHAQGKTDQAQADLTRLAKIRADREEAQAKRKAEADAKAVELEAKKAARGR